MQQRTPGHPFRDFSLTGPRDEPVYSYLKNGGGEYLMEVTLGTPPFSFVGIADTANDFTWTQCQPCREFCYNQTSPIFNPLASITNRKLPCDSDVCRAAKGAGCDTSNFCYYWYQYGTKTHFFSSGTLASDTFTFATTTKNGSGNGTTHVSIPGVVFGCGSTNLQISEASVIGLGYGPLSMGNTIGKFLNGTRFCYCLVLNYPGQPGHGNMSKISFGPSVVVSGPNTVSARLYSRSPDPFYYLNLEGFSVMRGRTRKDLATDAKKISYNSFDDGKGDAWSSQPGNMIIDTSTAQTFLSRKIWTDLVQILHDTINGTASGDDYTRFGFCYGPNNQGISFPDIVLHFTGGADLVLPSSTTFVPNDYYGKGAVCLTLVATDDVAILGNVAQGNNHIGFDLDNGWVSFQPTDCSKLV
ncbi:OLC1v1012673C1 [Oldenlandia corymbosa var. corymbosa]|uniref:OLC1v1012673C1 n=1 Tax=Oldenlandia corymbosa var. corymbosa TaxID=529605 RepID=A0AAV1DWF8_OLDCO|nr:OLC1v1012673C1 [Oldenlandia corymbosa var. corymbosa]